MITDIRYLLDKYGGRCDISVWTVPRVIEDTTLLSSQQKPYPMPSAASPE
jgi:hypothetical protein